MMGAPASDWNQLCERTNVSLGVGDPDYAGSYDRLLEAALGINA